MYVNKDKETRRSLELIKQRMMYCPLTGELRYRNIPQNGKNKGKAVGSLHNSGYKRFGMRVDGRLWYFLSHRVCWAIFKGVWPDNLVDHKDRNKLNNRISNLRECTKSQNVINSKTKNRLGFKGISIDTRYSKPRYRAYITSGHETKYLGSFDKPEHASKAYKDAALIYHKEFVCL